MNAAAPAQVSEFCVADYGGFCRSMAGAGWRIMARYGGLWRFLSQYDAVNSSILTTPDDVF